MWEQTRKPNLDPYIYSNGKVLLDWLGWCLAYVRTAFGTNTASTAWLGWGATKHKHQNRNFPKGVYFPMWFSHYATYNGKYDNWGHVVIAYIHPNTGAMTLWSSPISRKPYADTWKSIADVEKNYKSTFVGWSEDVCGTRVIQGVAMPYTDEQYNAVVRERDAERAKVNTLNTQVQTLSKQLTDNDKAHKAELDKLHKSVTELQDKLGALELTVDANQRMINDQEKVIKIKDDEIKRLEALAGEEVTVGRAISVLVEAIKNLVRR